MRTPLPEIGGLFFGLFLFALGACVLAGDGVWLGLGRALLPVSLVVIAVAIVRMRR